ncbi:MAG TPA: hypothetical protein VN026_17475 [Bacteroidia bacterium]|jgi:hypothetical protein|nr:hypothetical protein [Bacteroidia bacterium]
MENSKADNEEINIKQKAGVESNPLGDAFGISVSIPEKVEIKMVNASILSDYEIWIFISSILSNAVIGFWVAYSTNTNINTDKILFCNSCIFTGLFIITLIVAISKRYKLSKKSRTINLRTTKVEDESSS